MDRPPHQHRLQAVPVEKPERDPALAETDPWGLGVAPEAAAIPTSNYDSREAYLKWRDGVASSADVSAPDPAQRPTVASRVWAIVQPRLSFDRRIVAGLVLFGIAGALLIGLSRYEIAPTIKTVSGTTYNTALDRLASAVGAALDLVGQGPVEPAKTDVASNPRREIPNARRTSPKRDPINSSRALKLIPLIGRQAVHPDEPAPGVNADVNAAVDSTDAQDDSAVDLSIIYSPMDADISPPVAIRSPGIATGRGDREEHVLLIDVVVSETGDVESVRGRPQPATIGAALQSNMALSVVRTWRFSPARRDGQPVKYRTTVPFAETMNVGRHN